MSVGNIYCIFSHRVFHRSLEKEIPSLDASSKQLQLEKKTTENKLAVLEACQLDLEKDLHLKKDSYFVDRVQVLPTRLLEPKMKRRRGRI